jgi:antiviral helicase SKI2
MDRAPAPVANFVRGKSGYIPFKPGGLDDVILAAKQATGEPIKGLRTVPPGFSRGLRLPGDDVDEEALASLDDSTDTRGDQVYFPAVCILHYCSALIAQHADEIHVVDEERDFLPNGDSFGEVDELLPTTVRTSS